MLQAAWTLAGVQTEQPGELHSPCVADVGTSFRNKLAGPAVAAAKLPGAHVLRDGEVSAAMLTYAPAYRADHLVDLIQEDSLLEQVQHDSGSTETYELWKLLCWFVVHAVQPKWQLWIIKKLQKGKIPSSLASDEFWAYPSSFLPLHVFSFYSQQQVMKLGENYVVT